METILFFNSDSSAYWETLADCGSKMVVWGVAAEVLEILVKMAQLLRERNLWGWTNRCSTLKRAGKECGLCVEWFDKHELLLEIWGLCWWAVVVLGLMVELGGNQQARKI